MNNLGTTELKAIFTKNSTHNEQIKNINMSEHLVVSLRKYCGESIWSTAQTA